MPMKWTILANQIVKVVDLDHPAMTAMLVQSNDSLFTGFLLTSKTLQIYGIFNGKIEAIYFDPFYFDPLIELI